MLYPVPAVMVTCGTFEKSNIITVAWTGTLNTNPPMAYISVRKERFSHDIIKESGEFIINLTTEKLAKATDWCGVKSGKDFDKFAQTHLTKERAVHVACPAIAESPVNIECKVCETKELGSHTLFIANVVGVSADEKYMDENGRFELAKADPICYCHGEYYTLGKYIGKFGYSVTKKKKRRK